jgi:chorismate dehydratase
MFMQKIRVSPISFLNTLPLSFGIRHSNIINQIELVVDTPAQCANRLIEGSVDIGLVPVATIPSICNAQIISDFCIGVSGAVRTVVLVSEVPVNEINEIILDYQSRTSVVLARILVTDFWNLNVKFRNAKPGFEFSQVKGNTAAVVIGDKVFGIEKKYKYVLDLAVQWREYTGLPFVFACWVANCDLSQSFIHEFNEALRYGVEHINEAIDSVPNLIIPKNEALKYLSQNIDFNFTDDKREAMQLFLKKLEIISVPG